MAFPNSSIDSKLEYLNVDLRLYFQRFSQFTKIFKIRIFESCTSLSKAEHLRKANFEIFPAVMNIFKFLIFLSHSRTANINVSFYHVWWTFYHFKRLNPEISEDLMIMVVINWFKL